MSRFQMGAPPRFRTPRTLRLERDHEEMLRLRHDSTILDFRTKDDPPEEYQIVFRGRSLVPGKKGEPVLGGSQEVEIRLGGEYPRMPPQIRWKTKILHPNISGGSVCLGNFGSFWTPNFKLAEMVEVLWDYGRLAVLNPYHSYEGPGAPAKWSALDQEFVFPVDKRPLRDKVLPPGAGSSIVRPEPADENDILIIEDDRGACGA